MSLFPSSSFLTTNGLREYSQQIHPPPFFPTRPMAQSALQRRRWVRQLRANPEVCSSRWGGRLLLGGWGWAWRVAWYKLRGRTDTFSNSLCQAPLELASPSAFISKQQACSSRTPWLSSVCLRPWQWTSAFVVGVTHDPRWSAGLQAVNLRDCLLSERKREVSLTPSGIRWESPSAQKPALGHYKQGSFKPLFSGRCISFIFHQKHITFLLSNEPDT